MKALSTLYADWHYAVAIAFYRIAASGIIPAKWILPNSEVPAERAARKGVLDIEIVSHCWKYSHFLAYQLSSLIKYPPTKANITMTVYYNQDDAKTTRLLEFFNRQTTARVYWNFQALEKPSLFRRSIGRNRAALATRADWIWFTDCDLLFHEHCLDSLADELQGRRDILVYPDHERVTRLLPADSDMLQASSNNVDIYDIDTSRFNERPISKATGPLQIAHGDVARSMGYCRDIAVYQQPAKHWCKAHEDRAFRWLLGTSGQPIKITGVYRIRHIDKGRYKQESRFTAIRGTLRRIQSWYRDLKHKLTH